MFRLLMKIFNILFENVENVKSSSSKSAIFYSFSIFYKCGNDKCKELMKNSLMQLLKLHEFLAEPFAQLLIYMVKQEETSLLVEEMLCEIGNTEFNSVNEAILGKIYGTFLICLSESLPRLLLKNISYIVDFIRGDPYTLRLALLECLSNIICFYLISEKNEVTSNQIKSFFRVIEERFMDMNAFVRTKVLSICITLSKQVYIYKIF